MKKSDEASIERRDVDCGSATGAHLCEDVAVRAQQHRLDETQQQVCEGGRVRQEGQRREGHTRKK